MSIPVPLDRLRDAIRERGGHAYVLTVCDDMRPHAVHAPVRWQGDLLAAEVGRRSAANATARPPVSLLYPLRTPDDYSLILDGTAAVEGGLLLITPARAVLHRPARKPDPQSTCGADCVPLLPEARQPGAGRPPGS
jgi:hypothetical protein